MILYLFIKLFSFPVSSSFLSVYLCTCWYVIHASISLHHIYKDNFFHLTWISLMSWQVDQWAPVIIMSPHPTDGMTFGCHTAPFAVLETWTHSLESSQWFYFDKKLNCRAIFVAPISWNLGYDLISTKCRLSQGRSDSVVNSIRSGRS